MSKLLESQSQIAVESTTALGPVRHIAIHPRAEAGAVAMLIEVGQFVNQHILQQVRSQPSQVGVEPDAGSGRGAGAPAGFHLPQTDALGPTTHHGDPAIQQSRQPFLENSFGFGLGSSWRQLIIGSGLGIDIARTGQTFSSGCNPAVLAVDKGTNLVIAQV